MTAHLHHGDCRTVLATMPAASIDAVVTDPPYELGFMGKRWDATGIAYDVAMWAEVLRVLKPGGHLLAFGGTRTYHRMACAIEDAGFEIRDSIHWLYGSGFPKSLDVSKAIDKAAGAEREVVGERTHVNGGGTSYELRQGPRVEVVVDITAPATDAARQWAGWGTALKPAHEPIVVARKPLDGTVAANVLQHGTGAINIDACRIPMPDADRDKINSMGGFGRKGWTRADGTLRNIYASDGGLPVIDSHAHDLGRWPANVVLSHGATCGDQCAPGCPIAAIDQQADGASRFFTHADLDPLADLPFAYVAKPSRSERNAGLDNVPPQLGGSLAGGNDTRRNDAPQRTERHNYHPTVKPLALMRWLVRLVTPPDGTVLDPFAGSGTTLAAAILEHRHTIGIELTADYLPIINGRIAWAQQQAHHDRNQPHQETLDL